ncbi:MAG: hypothetical protein SGJ09_09175 [Phycisphaerae bacterium]|nr:hypothetical protein [Phycisphaerae bacterium]
MVFCPHADPAHDDDAVLESLRSHEDAAAWRMLVDRFEPVFIGVSRRLGLSAADAADAAQQTLLDMVREMREGRFDRARGGLRRWTLGILRHRVADITRARSRSHVDDQVGDATRQL